MRREAGARFLGSYVNKIDAKGRLATPALFRRVLNLPEENFIYCIPSTQEPCIECGGADYIDSLMAMIEQLDPFSPERISLERTIATQITPVSPDKEGRINLPDDLKRHANLNGEALFAGHSNSFQIWNPETFNDALAEAKKIASAARLSLRNPALPGREA